LETRICRTCGALLPLFSRSPRSRILTTPKKDKKKKKKKEKSVKERVLEYRKEKGSEAEKLELHEIPKEEDKQEIVEEGSISKPPIEYQEIPLPKIENSLPNIENTQIPDQRSPEILKEITPQPFRGSVIKPPKPLGSLPSISNDSILDALSELKQSVVPKTPVTPTPTVASDADVIALKQKRLEKDMSKVLGFLSKKISVKSIEPSKAKPTVKKEPEKEIPPTSMNEILKRLLTLDLHIEASAVIKTDGTILASAISSRISDSLFATIGINLSMIGTDIIDGLNAGSLKSISVRGTDGVLDLAPIDRDNPSVKDMILILLSHPKVKSGIISFAVNIVKKQIKTYLGLDK